MIPWSVLYDRYRVQADSYAAMALVLDELERRLSARLAGTTGPVAAAG
jgi:hypothetical protein